MKFLQLAECFAKTVARKLSAVCVANVVDETNFGRYKFAYIEPVRGCPVKCIPCPVGREVLVKHSVAVLRLDIAQECVKRLMQDYNIQTLILGNWGEPLLHPQFSELIGIVKSSGLKEVGMSTSLSVPCDMAKIIDSGLDFVQVSMSGVTKEIYNLSHRQGDFDLVMDNLRSLADLNRNRMKPVGIAIRWHRYRHNEFQYNEVIKLCTDLGIGIIPYFGHLGSIEALHDWSENAVEMPLNSFIRESVFTEFIKKACELNKGATHCPQSDFLVIDADGSLIFCCSCYKNYKPNLDFLSANVADVADFKKANSSICSSCLACGWAGYMNRPKTLEEYGGSIDTPV